MLTEDTLREFGKKTISRAELAGLAGTNDTISIADAIGHLVENNVLTPFKSARYAGPANHRVYDRYRVNLSNEQTPYDKQELSALHPRIVANGWLARHPEAFAAHEGELKALSDWLWTSTQTPVIALNERAFEIWRDEKALDSHIARGKAFSRVLSRCGIAVDDLRCYATYDGAFLDYVPRRVSSARIVISENKATWHSMRRLMFEDSQRSFFGVSVDGVAFGSGNKACRKGALADYAAFLGVESPVFLYWGDVDRMGISILGSVLSQGRIDVAPFVRAYDVMAARMSRLGLRIDDLPRSDDHRESLHVDVPLERYFDKATASLFELVLAENRRIPQEIVPITAMQESA